MTVMMALGEYRFSLSTAAYNELKRVSEWRWAKQDRMGRKPGRQFTGPDGDTITLPGTVYPHFRGGLGQINAMRAEANKGKPLMMVDGQGKIWGKWCITRIEEGQSAFLADGIPLKMDFSVTLEEYAPDEENAL